MLEDLSDVVDDMSEGEYTVTRSGPSIYTNGRLDIPSTTTFPILASVQVPTGRNKQDLPEGSRVEDVRVVFTSTTLNTQTASQGPDQIEIDGELYEVNSCDPWGTVAGYVRVIVMKVGH